MTSKEFDRRVNVAIAVLDVWGRCRASCFIVRDYVSLEAKIHYNEVMRNQEAVFRNAWLTGEENIKNIRLTLVDLWRNYCHSENSYKDW